MNEKKTVSFRLSEDAINKLNSTILERAEMLNISTYGMTSNAVETAINYWVAQGSPTTWIVKNDESSYLDLKFNPKQVKENDDDKL